METTIHNPRLTYKNQQGMILLFTLCCFCIISYLVLLQCEMILLQQKYLNTFVDKQKTLEHMEAFARNLIHQPSSQWPSECIRKGTDDSQKTTDLLSCVARYKTTQLRYIIEQLPTQACMQMRQANQRFSTQPWRITIHPEQLPHRSLSNLQIYFIAPSAMMDCPADAVVVVSPGISSWLLYS